MRADKKRMTSPLRLEAAAVVPKELGKIMVNLLKN
jgi:hypothetical protein